jgi:hypothetical protein
MECLQQRDEHVFLNVILGVLTLGPFDVFGVYKHLNGIVDAVAF